MSSTARGADRRRQDWYATPAWCVHRLLEAVALPGGDWLEPCAGDGAIIRAVAEHRQDVTWNALDIEPQGPNIVQQDYLTLPQPHATVALTNPPFILAEQFLRKLLDEADWVVLLLRLNWIGATRAPLMRKLPPDIYVLPNRPSFTNGGTDSIEYAWMVWGPGVGGRWKMLADTPLADRRVVR